MPIYLIRGTISKALLLPVLKKTKAIKAVFFVPV